MAERVRPDIMSMLEEPAYTVQAINVKQHAYLTLMSKLNNLSYSYMSKLDECPRYFELDKLTAINRIKHEETNIHFLFGHALGTGVQEILIHGDVNKAIFAAMQAWQGPLMIADDKKKKSIFYAIHGIKLFASLRPLILAGWELAYFNGKPAVELEFMIEFLKGYNFFGHIDVVLYNPTERRYLVLEIKTTGARNYHDAMFRNSPQALGYSIIIDALAKNKAETLTYEVLYLVYNTVKMAFEEPIRFNKSKKERAEWLESIMMQIDRVDMYKKHEHFPKNGNSCFAWGRVCQYFGICDMDNSAFDRGTPVSNKAIKLPEFQFKLIDLINVQIGDL